MPYTVHIFREMRLRFDGIEASSHEAAADIARELSLKVADDIDECDGETLAASVDLVGDDDHSTSLMIDFEAGRLLNSAPKLLSLAKQLHGLCAIQANLCSTASEEERSRFISSVYALWNGVGIEATTEAEGIPA